MLTIHSMTPFFHQQPRPQPITHSRKEETAEKPVSFQDILAQKMKDKSATKLQR
ncbi:hypothetical protein [Paenibacillus lemnae]|uniref:Uncharacterized protein n=1 Tax=Paenibacillus lemnae TaxID=1330551 RepID=A0A848MDG6_PAELE|nr:hypothetical protein [Paenibacillus lemnae]NMO98082.1 hypothetical protein [Paenibacillus lemnae]